MSSLAGLVQQGDGVEREELPVAARQLEAVAQVVGGVVGAHRLQAQAGVEPGEQRLVRTQGEPVLELGQADEDEAEQGAAVPLVVEQYVQVGQHG
jgi:hypothetical protein